MQKIEEKIMKTDFRQLAKHLAGAVVFAILIGGIASGCALRTQIGETVAYLRTAQTSHQAEEVKERQEKAVHGGQDENDTENVSEDIAAGVTADGLHEKEVTVDKYPDGDKQGEHMKNNAYDEHEKDGGGGIGIFEDANISQPQTSAIVTVGVFAVVLILLFCAYWLIVASWLYKSAVLSAMNPALWMLLGFIGNICAVALFIIVRRFTKIHCVSCGRWQNLGIFCSSCGASLQKKCKNCGVVLSQNDKFCRNCGTPFSDKDQSNDSTKQ